MISLFLLQDERFGNEYLVYDHSKLASSGWQYTPTKPWHDPASFGYQTPQDFISYILKARPDWSERFHHLVTTDKFDNLKHSYPELFI